MGTVRGNSASIAIYSGSTLKNQTVWGISDFSLNFDRGTVEQELVGANGNWFAQGALSVDGSYTACRFAASAQCDSLISIIESSYIKVSGSTGSNLSWYFTSCQITGYDIALGNADTITEASIDFVVMHPYRVRIDASTGHIDDDTCKVS